MSLAPKFRKLGLPLARIASSAQAAVAQTSIAVVTTAATNASPYGFSQAQADALVAQHNALVADVAALTALVNSLRSSSVTNGLIKGAA